MLFAILNFMAILTRYFNNEARQNEFHEFAEQLKYIAYAYIMLAIVIAIVVLATNIHKDVDTIVQQYDVWHMWSAYVLRTWCWHMGEHVYVTMHVSIW